MCACCWPNTKNTVTEGGPTTEKGKRCDCISVNTVYKMAIVVGTILLVIGILALAGHHAPSPLADASPILSHLNKALDFVAKQLGTDPLVLVTFPLAIGGTLILSVLIDLQFRQIGAQHYQ
jgi:hypothetical protein